jgi:hypothetical protein
MTKARAMVQKSKYLHIFFLTKKVRKSQQLGHGMPKLGFEK